MATTDKYQKLNTKDCQTILIKVMVKPTFAYIMNSFFPSDKAHSIYLIKSVEAMTNLGYNSTLIVPKSQKTDSPKTYQYLKSQNIDPNLFRIKFLVGIYPSKSLLLKLLPKKYNYPLTSLFFSFQALIWLIWNKPNVIQIADPELILLLKFVCLFYNPRIIADFHIDPPKWLSPKTASHVDKWIVNNHYYYAQLKSQGISSKILQIMPNGVDLKDYVNLEKEKIRNSLGIPKTAIVVSYIGRFETMGHEKGLFKMLEVVNKLQKEIPQIYCLIVGGPKHLSQKYQAYANNLGLNKNNFLIRDQVPLPQVAQLIKASDIGWLVYPNVPHFKNKMSPMKVLEYAAAGVPMICSDFPSLKSFVPGKGAEFVEPNDTNVQAKAVKKLINFKSNNVLTEFANSWNWQKRASKIISE